MERKVFDCTYVEGDDDCVFAVIGKTEEEVIEAQMKHAAEAHAAQDSSELREWVRAQIMNESEWMMRRMQANPA